jgi:hypothetical protein
MLNISNNTQQTALSHRKTNWDEPSLEARAKTALVPKRFGSHPGRMMCPGCHIWAKSRPSLGGRPFRGFWALQNHYPRVSMAGRGGFLKQFQPEER